MTKILRNGVTVGSETKIRDVFFATRWIIVVLDDDREILVPISWYPRLNNATPEQRMDYEIVSAGTGIHWPQLDEDLGLQGFMAI